jgi:hypothetical protein
MSDFKNGELSFFSINSMSILRRPKHFGNTPLTVISTNASHLVIQAKPLSSLDTGTGPPPVIPAKARRQPESRQNVFDIDHICQ